MAKVTRPEELIINCYARLRMATGNIATGLSVLALLWSTVVLLGGFVSDLKVQEFWYLTVLSFAMACRMVDITDNEISKGIYFEEISIISIMRRLKKKKWITAGWSWFSQILLVIVLVPKMILAFFVSYFIQNLPFIILYVSVARLVKRDYGITGDDTVKRAKVKAALDIFYALVAFQSLVATYWVVLLLKMQFATKQVASLTVKQGEAEKQGTEGKAEKWGTVVIRMYYLETTSKLKKDGKLPGNWNLIVYGVELLQSSSGDDHLWGARLLERLFNDENGTSSVRQELLSSRLSIQNLIGMIGWRGTDDNIESRERAARIVAHVASDLHITHFSGTLQSICSLLESCRKQSCEPPNAACVLDDNNLDKERSGPEKNDQHVVQVNTGVQEQPGDEHEQLANSSFDRVAKKKRTSLCVSFKKWREENKLYNPKYRHPYESRGTKELISQGLMILEGLTKDEVNCTDISKDERLLSRITEPLKSHDFLSKLQDNTMLELLITSRTLTVLSRLLTIPGDGCTNLHQELVSNMEAVCNLMDVLKIDSEGAQQLHGKVVEILTELALKSFTKPAFGESAFMLNKVCENLEMLVEEIDGNNIAAEPDRVRVKAGDALQRLLPFQSAGIVKAAAKISKKDAIDSLTKLVDRTLSGKMGTPADAATQGNEEHSEERDVSVISKQAFMEDMLLVAAAMRVVNVTSEQDFTRPSPEDEALVKKVIEILEVNERSTAEFFKILKVICQVVVPMIQAVPSYIKYFNEQDFLKETLTEILETMNGRELPEFEVGRVKEMKERLS